MKNVFKKLVVIYASKHHMNPSGDNHAMNQ